MLPLTLLKAAENAHILIELKNGDTYNGTLVSCNMFMNINLKDVVCTSRDGDRFWKLNECYVRGNSIKYLRIPDEIISIVPETTHYAPSGAFFQNMGSNVEHANASLISSLPFHHSSFLPPTHQTPPTPSLTFSITLSFSFPRRRGTRQRRWKGRGVSGPGRGVPGPGTWGQGDWRTRRGGRWERQGGGSGPGPGGRPRGRRRQGKRKGRGGSGFILKIAI